MENEWYDYFVESLYRKFPKKAQLTQELIDLLNIEREAVYRRLRKEVQFPAHEIVKIATEWSISLDEIVSFCSGQVPFQMRQMNYIDPSEEEMKFLRLVIQSIGYLKNFPDAEFMDICNKLPRQLLAGYKCLNQFYLFKWIYQYGNEKEIVPFSQITISDEQFELTADYYRAIKQVPETNFIWDRMLFDYLVSDITYFHSIRMITDDEKACIKKDLFALLDYMLEVANKGYYPETKKKVNLYVSQLNIDTNYSYAFTPNGNVCFIHVFEKFEIHTFNRAMVSNFKMWMQLKKRSSIQISEVDEKSRMEYFSTQRQIIDGL